jgi:serine/threonine protein phosphatase PrpC
MSILSRSLRSLGFPSPAVTKSGQSAFTSFARTHVGHVRQINEDRLFDCPEQGVWAIADGMGGHHGGDVAAEIVIASLREAGQDGNAYSEKAIEAALHSANRRIRDHVLSASGIIGSTAIVLYIANDRAHLFWAGDSRAYRIRHDHFELLTRDHSLVQELVDAGAISQEDAATHPRANVVTRALGIDSELAIDRLSFDLIERDCILLCSDGLSRSLRIDPTQQRIYNCESFADRLLREALIRDGSDNISFVIIHAETVIPTAKRVANEH